MEEYLVNAEQMRAITRLTDAARLLSAALPVAYTATPLGGLEDLIAPVFTLCLLRSRSSIVLCQECERWTQTPTRCAECDLQRCGPCQYMHTHCA